MSYETALSVQRLKVLGRKQGFLTYAQINNELPSEVIGAEKVEAAVAELVRSGIRVVKDAPSGGS